MTLITPTAPELFQELESQNPAAAAAVQAMVLEKIQTVEKDGPGATSKEKQIAALQLAYEGLDMLIGAPGPVDFLFKSLIIPAIPDLINWLVEELHKKGIFSRKG